MENQENLFNEILAAKFGVQSLASFVQNDFSRMLEDGTVDEQDLSDTLLELDDVYDKFITRINDLRHRSKILISGHLSKRCQNKESVTIINISPDYEQSENFKVLMYGNMYVDANMLVDGIYSSNKPFLYEEDVTIESVIQYSKQVVDEAGLQILPDTYFENLSLCKLVPVSISIHPEGIPVTVEACCCFPIIGFCGKDKPCYNSSKCRLNMVLNYLEINI